jgi:hypothetical protein
VGLPLNLQLPEEEEMYFKINQKDTAGMAEETFKTLSSIKSVKRLAKIIKMIFFRIPEISKDLKNCNEHFFFFSTEV